MLDKVTKIFAISSIALIILGLFDLNSFYSKFGIPINNFLTPSEIILSFSQLNLYSFPNLLIFTIVVFLNLYISYHRTKGIININEENIGNIKNTEFSKTNPKFAKLIIVEFFSILFIYFVAFKLYKNIISLNYYNSFNIAFLGYILWIAVYRTIETVLFLFFEIKDRHYFSKEELPFVMAILLILSLMVSINFTNDAKHSLSMKGITEYNVKAIFEEETQSSSISNIYIGSTENYIIFYNLLAKKSIIKQKSEIKTIEIVKFGIDEIKETKTDTLNNN